MGQDAIVMPELGHERNIHLQMCTHCMQNPVDPISLTQSLRLGRGDQLLEGSFAALHSLPSAIT